MVAAMPKAAMSTTPDATTSLITAAEQLFASRGIDGVSLREINREAGQRNTTSLQYHFGDRQGLLRAIMVKHGRQIDARRHELLDDYQAAGIPDIRRLVSAFVLPLVAKLDDPCGRNYLRIAAELVNRDNREIEPGEPSILADPAGRDPRDSITRWGRLVAPDAAAARRRAAAAPPLRGDAVRPHRARPAGERVGPPHRRPVHQPPPRPRHVDPRHATVGGDGGDGGGAATSAALSVVSCSSVGCSTVASRSA